ncbi:MAG: rhodanese-like domain-containing protein [Gammaproteobacteria bacterium]|nr:rhodanese-like domain-containing protein [Gammaproteobacteria bacterium]MBU1724914.1 rhodanese-like domain-containing protein [Gammaproteobacteria bacterium]MBU2004882.1 rhodanese-like domain-containing protein [Gammaproteobacteria bacterium]
MTKIQTVPVIQFCQLWVLLLLCVVWLADAIAADDVEVKITEKLPYLEIVHEGKTIRIERIQDTANQLNNSFAKTSRPCPPFCIHPIEIAPGVRTVGELELLDFLSKQVRQNTGLLVDARMPDWYEKGTIPGAINIPFTILSAGLENPHTSRILKLLGAEEQDGKWNFANARELLLFCNGMWCDQSPRAINNLLSLGYPAERLLWYRDGMQSWQMLGLTVSVPEK